MEHEKKSEMDFRARNSDVIVRLSEIGEVFVKCSQKTREIPPK
jgi:hypothetical protein